MLKITAGKYCNRKIKEPDPKYTRPTPEKVRQAIFNSIQFEINNSNFLDLFSGSGIFALEAISRNANKVVLIEKNIKVFNIIKENFAFVSKEENFNLINADALFYISNTFEKFDFIFLDAPFDSIKIVNEILNIISKKDILNSNGQIILETNKANEIILQNNLTVNKEKTYGKICILFINKK